MTTTKQPTKTEAVERNMTQALDRLGVEPGVIFQIGYYAPDLDAAVERYVEQGHWKWSKQKQFEEDVRVYPGSERTDGVIYVARSSHVMPSFELELVQPLTEPNYINMLGFLPGQVCHLGVRAEQFEGEDDIAILRRITRHVSQKIQSGIIRRSGAHYSIYNVEQLLPVKIVRKSANSED